jgi:chromate transport protein ChrA
MVDLLAILVRIGIISLTSYSGSAQSLFYEIGVTQLHWITNQDYVSYLGFGFASPGPQVFSLATFIGYGKAGLLGGLVGTFAIYAMPVTLAILSGRYRSSSTSLRSRCSPTQNTFGPASATRTH